MGDPKPVIGGLAFALAPPRASTLDDEEEWGVDEDGDPLSYEAWLIRHQ